MFRYPNSEDYSGLEVGHWDSGLEVRHPVPRPPPPPLSPPLNFQVPADNSREKYGWWAKRRLWLAFIIIGMIVIIASIVGGVVGGLSASGKCCGHSRSNFLASSSSSVSGSLPRSSGTGVAVMSGSATILGGYAYPTPVSWGYPHLHVFSLDQNRAMVGKWRTVTAPGQEVWNPTDGSFDNMGGCVSTSEPFITANTRGLGYVDLFFSGCNHTLWHKWWDNGWHPSSTDYEQLGGTLTSSPTIVSWSKDRRDVFFIGSHLGVGLYETYTDSSMWGWSDSFGDNWLAFAPTAVSRAKGMLDIFLVGNDKALYHKYFNGNAWVPPNAGVFDNLGGYCTSRPVAISSNTGRIDIFVRGGDSGLWHLSYDSNTGWTNWTSISSSTAIQAEPDAVSLSSNRIHVFAWGATDRALLHKSFNGTMWVPQDGFENLGGDLGGPPKAVCDIEGESVNVFAFGRYGNLLRKAWNQTQGQWIPKDSFQDLGAP